MIGHGVRDECGADHDPAWAEIDDFRRWYGGRSRRRRCRALTWLLVRVHRCRAADVAWLVDRDESTVRGHVREVDRALLIYPGRDVIEDFIGRRRPVGRNAA